MNDDYGWVPFVFFTFLAALIGSYAFGYNTGEHYGRNQGIIYCMEKPDKCKIEYQYLKLENSK